MLELEAGWQAFSELRDVLQLTNAELPNGEIQHHQLEFPALEARRLASIENAADPYQQELRKGIENTHASPANIILKYFKG